MDNDRGSAQPLPELAPGGPPPGLYPDPYQAGMLRFWDGRAWAAFTQTPGPPARSSTAGNALSVWAFVLGVIGVTLPAFICGVMAIRRLPPGEHGRRTLAWLGIAFSVLWVVGGGAVLLNRPTASTSGKLSGGQLHVGQCVEVPNPVPTSHPQFDPRACGSSHNGEVMTIGHVPDATFPGDDQMAAEVKSMCRADLFTYVGAEQSSLHYVSLFPDRASWAAGDRTYLCMAVDRNGDVTKTLQGSKL